MSFRRSGKLKFFLLIVILFATAFFVIHNVALQTKQTSSSSTSEKSVFFFSQQLKVGPLAHNIRIHETGFWSGTDAKEYHAQNHAPKLGRRLLSFFKSEPNGTSILDLGGGSGLQVANFLSHGLFASCYDGNPDAQTVSSGVCATLNLAKPIAIAPHDWVLCLSVGRQIPPEFVPQFITNLHNHNKIGIILYWGDGRALGHHKVPKSVKNNSQVLEAFSSLNLHYELDVSNTNFLRGEKQGSDDYSLQVLRKVKDQGQDQGQGQRLPEKKPIVITIVSCGLEKLEQAVTSIKSAILFSQHSALHVHIFTDLKSWENLGKQMQYLADDVASMATGVEFSYSIHLTTFPPELPGSLVPWGKVFKQCSLQRLFLPSALPEVDATIYLDADTLVLSNITELWAHFHKMNDSQLIGLTELNVGSLTSYFVKNNISHYGANGLNCGVALMNLTRMRAFGFEDKIKQIRTSTESIRPSTTGDQYLQNVLYAMHPELVQILGCEYNLRALQCRCPLVEQCGCSSALARGVALIHGTKDGFKDETRLPLFRHIYEHFKTFDFINPNMWQLLKKLQREFNREDRNGTCFFKSAKNFYKKMDTYLYELEGL